MRNKIVLILMIFLSYIVSATLGGSLWVYFHKPEATTTDAIKTKPVILKGLSPDRYSKEILLADLMKITPNVIAYAVRKRKHYMYDEGKQYEIFYVFSDDRMLIKRDNYYSTVDPIFFDSYKK